MKIITNTTIYRCEYCRKMYQVGAACKLHEIRCKKNPENIAACLCCDFLKKTTKTISYDNGYMDIDVEKESFFCDKKKLGLFPSKVFHMGLPEKYPDSFEGEERMPSKCDLFQFDPGF